MKTGLLYVLLAVQVTGGGLAPAAPVMLDLDRDGVPDHLEQELLTRFAPTLLLARGECDGAPASFIPNRTSPVVQARNGTLYGQAFPIVSSDGRSHIELHFFHLWSRDCGRLGHDLDAEHVSAIVSAPRADAPALAWIADVWFAAAHQGSACDASSAAPARVIGAEANGPRVFVSKGKHASYLDRGQCKWGCGGDVCGDDKVIVATTVVNIGERAAPLNGALWVHSRRWPLAEKLSSDFNPPMRARLAETDHVTPLMMDRRAPQAPVLAGDTALDGLGTAATHTGGAVTTAAKAVSKFFQRMIP